MSKVRPADNRRTRAETLVSKSEAIVGGEISLVDRETLTDAVRQDLHAISSEPGTGDQSIRLVLVEDSEDDAELILHELRRAGYTVTAKRVETAQGLVDVLAESEWDLVISDHCLPNLSAPEALCLVQAHTRYLPFIIVSGRMGEALAVSAMKAGAADYLVKGQLTRLGPAVRRELADAEQRRQRARAEETLGQTEQQLRQAQKMEAVGRLASGIAHDFNNLLTAILGYSELVLRDMPTEAAGRADVEEIRKAGVRAAALTRQLLAFSRQQVLEPRVANLNHIVGDVEQLLRRMIGADVELVMELNAAIGHVRVDSGQMEQVLMNLALNARDAMPKGGRLRFQTRDEVLAHPRQLSGATMDAGRYVIATVSDTGAGMTPDIVKQIFDPFFTTKSLGRGTGLGLSTVYGIVKQSNGFIFVTSELGEGTVFEIFLPCVDEPVEAMKRGATPTANLEGSETILLVDDDAGVRDLLARALKANGYHVLVAPEGLEATSAAVQHAGAIHLLITDLVMPGIGGAELALQLTATRPSLAVLYISGYPDRRESDLDGSAGAGTYLQKPFTPSQLVRKVRELLDASGPRIMTDRPYEPRQAT
jgi:two-component system, cell cycle sensor histidine kinase and response regulator CckA